MNAAITRVYAVMASWTPPIVVSRSATIWLIETFMTELSSTITNCAAARIRIAVHLPIGSVPPSSRTRAARSSLAAGRVRCTARWRLRYGSRDEPQEVAPHVRIPVRTPSAVSPCSRSWRCRRWRRRCPRAPSRAAAAVAGAAGCDRDAGRGRLRPLRPRRSAASTTSRTTAPSGPRTSWARSCSRSPRAWTTRTWSARSACGCWPTPATTPSSASGFTYSEPMRTVARRVPGHLLRDRR